MFRQLILVGFTTLALLCAVVRGDDSEEQLNFAINEFESDQECFDIFDKIRMIAAGVAFPFVSDSETETLCYGNCGEIGRRILQYDELAQNSVSLFLC